MAEFNSCAKLQNQIPEADKVYKKLLQDGKDPFKTMFEMQLKLQKELHKRLPENNPDPEKLEKIGQIFEWLRDNKQSIDDEYRELIDALPGMGLPEKDRSAVWKKWKSKYTEIRNQKLSDLSKDDRFELECELVDILHFYMNWMIALGVDPEKMFKIYYVKNAENFRRYENGY